MINKSLACSGCGAQLHFAPGGHQLKCDYCGCVNDIPAGASNADISNNFDSFVKQNNALLHSADAGAVKCVSCGSITDLAQNIIAQQCPFCQSPLVLDLRHHRGYIRPHSILPFTLNREDAAAAFHNWAKHLSVFKPDDLVQSINNSSITLLQGWYLPHFIFDAQVVSQYGGSRGEYYWTTETYVDSNKQTKTRRKRHTAWASVSGAVTDSFKNMLIPATQSLNPKTLDKLGPWDYEAMVPFDECYLSGFGAESYQLSPEDGRRATETEIAADVKRSILRDIGGDEQKIAGLHTEYVESSVEYTLLPVWISSFNYNNKTYQYTINANTGEVIGNYPLSRYKIAFACILIAGIIIAIILYNNPGVYSHHVK